MSIKHAIIEESKSLGFLNIGFSKAKILDKEARKLESWLSKGYHGEMQWMENNFDLRIDPTKLVPGAKTVISLSYNYFNPVAQEQESPKISMYALGEDYHKVVKKKLKQLFHFIKEKVGNIEGRMFVDSAPIMERDWAVYGGLGWAGKHTLLLNPKAGSYFFLAEIILDLDLEADAPMKDHCGTCTRCIDACPTEAISPEGYVLDGSKCISYLTIELKNEIPDEFIGKMEGWAFGCDICQDVCPWNRFSKRHEEPSFEPNQEIKSWKKTEWEEITEEIFDRVFSKTPVKRTGFKGIKRNLDFIKKSK
jgi:epoxyqueuosine reductase